MFFFFLNQLLHFQFMRNKHMKIHAKQMEELFVQIVI